MKILITGSNGLVGTSLQNIYDKNDGNEYIFLKRTDCDLRNKEKLDNIFRNGKFDKVIHLASIVAGLYGNIDNNYNFLVDNIYINTNILECCRKYNIKRLINILSTCVFPEQNDFNILKYPLTSDQILNGRPHSSNSGYANSKRMLYIGSKLLANSSNIEIVNLIPTNLYGLNDNYHLHNSHVVPALIHKMYIAKRDNKSLIIKGNGMAKRQFLYSDDLAKIILNFVDLKLDKQFNCLIVSPPKENEIIIKELVNDLIKIFNFKNKIIYDDDYDNGQEYKTADSLELLNYFPDFKFKLLKDGLSETINYFIKNYETIRK